MYAHYLLTVLVHSSNPPCWYTEDHILSYVILNRWQNNQIPRENEWYYKSMVRFHSCLLVNGFKTDFN